MNVENLRPVEHHKAEANSHEAEAEISGLKSGLDS